MWLHNITMWLKNALVQLDGTTHNTRASSANTRNRLLTAINITPYYLLKLNETCCKTKMVSLNYFNPYDARLIQLYIINKLGKK